MFMHWNLENANKQQQFDDFNVCALSKLRLFFQIAKGSNTKKAVRLFGLKIKQLLSPVIIFLTDFEADHQSYTTNCQKKKVVFQFYSFPKAWLPFGILSSLIEFSLK